MPAAKCSYSRMVYYQNELYFFGGHYSDLISAAGQHAITSIYKYNIETDTWSEYGTIPDGAKYSSFIQNEDKVYAISGGTNTYGNINNKATYVYSLTNGTWTQLADLNVTHPGGELVYINGKLYSISGQTSTVEVYSVNDSQYELIAPTNLIASSGDSKVNLSWNLTDGATSYNIMRSTSSGGTYEIIASSVGSNSYIDLDVINGTTYYYVVTAVSSDTESDYSNEASATPSQSSDIDNQALLRITLVTGEVKEYEMTAIEVNKFVDWYNNGNNTTFIINKTYNLGPFESRDDYIVYDKICYFELMKY